MIVLRPFHLTEVATCLKGVKCGDYCIRRGAKCRHGERQANPLAARAGRRPLAAAGHWNTADPDPVQDWRNSSSEKAMSRRPISAGGTRDTGVDDRYSSRASSSTMSRRPQAAGGTYYTKGKSTRRRRAREG